MATAVIMPALGESVTEGTVTTWLKSVGDTVALDEPLVEVSTDKVDSEVPSPVAGVLLQILVPEDETVESALSWPSLVTLPRPRKTLLPPHRKAHPPRRPLPRHNPHPLLPLLRRPRHR